MQSGQQIAAMLQLDMIGYTNAASKQTIHIIPTDTSPILVRHLKDLMSNYLGGDWKVSELSAGTSDHRSWHRNGIHAAFAFEDPLAYNHALHSSDDTSARINFNLAARFTKLALTFLAHEAGLVSASSEVNSVWTSQLSTKDSVKLSLSKSGVDGYRFAAAVPQALEAISAELCKVSSGQELGCQSLVTNAGLAKNQDSRSFFVSDSNITPTPGDIWRFHLYNGAGGLVAVRTVKLRND